MVLHIFLLIKYELMRKTVNQKDNTNTRGQKKKRAVQLIAERILRMGIADVVQFIQGLAQLG